MQRFLRTSLSAVLTVACGAAVAGTITGSAHDFSGDSWNPGGQICITCHAPHNNLSAQGALLWNHDITTQTFTVYSSPTFSGVAGQPQGISKLCLSCHDGTIALDSFGGDTGSSYVHGRALIGTDLSNDHPISFLYSTTNEELNPVTTAVTFADNSTGTIADMLDSASMLQCSSCHDVHNSRTDGSAGSKLLVVDNRRSALCLTCHQK